MVNIFRKVVWSLESRGVLRTLQLIKRNLAYELSNYLDSSFDRKFGTRTSGRLPLNDLKISSSNADYGVYYEATSEKIFHYLIRSLEPIDYSKFHYYDYGSGMGRTLLMASNYPFRSITGIEFSEELHLIATSNVALYKKETQKCRNIHPILMDAELFQPAAEPSVFFFYNPFAAPVMEKVFRQIKKSTLIHDHENHIIYYNPLSGYVFDSDPFTHKIKDVALPHDWTRLIQRKAKIYSHIPTG